MLFLTNSEAQTRWGGTAETQRGNGIHEIIGSGCDTTIMAMICHNLGLQWPLYGNVMHCSGHARRLHNKPNHSGMALQNPTINWFWNIDALPLHIHTSKVIKLGNLTCEAFIAQLIRVYLTWKYLKKLWQVIIETDMDPHACTYDHLAVIICVPPKLRCIHSVVYKLWLDYVLHHGMIEGSRIWWYCRNQLSASLPRLPKFIQKRVWQQAYSFCLPTIVKLQGSVS